jgi:hypothetical protein
MHLIGNLLMDVLATIGLLLTWTLAVALYVGVPLALVVCVVGWPIAVWYERREKGQGQGQGQQ